MLIDFHAHLFPDAIAPRAVDRLISGTLREEGRAIPPRGEATEGGILASAEREAVTLSVILPIATKPTQTESILAFAADINRRYSEPLRHLLARLSERSPIISPPSPMQATLPVVLSLDHCAINEEEREAAQSPLLLSFASVHPDDEGAEDTLKRIAEQGFLGIKLHPEFQHFELASPRAVKLIALAESLGLITVVHAGRDIGMPPPPHGAPEAIAHLLDYIEGSRFVAAHLGGFRMWDDVERYLVGRPLSLDVSYLGMLDGEPTSETMRRIIKNHGADKILFGSDYPWKSPREVVGRMRTLALSEGELDRIFWYNAYRMLFC